MAGSGTNTCTKKLKPASNVKTPAHLLESWMKSPLFKLFFLLYIHYRRPRHLPFISRHTFSSREISCVYVSCAWKCMNLMLDASFISVMMLTWGNNLKTEHSWHISDGTHVNNPISCQHHAGWHTLDSQEKREWWLTIHRQAESKKHHGPVLKFCHTKPHLQMNGPHHYKDLHNFSERVY